MTPPLKPESHAGLSAAQEHRLAVAITDALEFGNEHLPYRITLRLEQSRQAALAVAGAQHLAQLQPATGSAQPNGAVALAQPDRFLSQPGFEHRRWWRIGSVVLPMLIVVAGLAGIGLWHETDDLVDLAEVDAGLLLTDDELPVSAMADRGFNVFLRNTRQ
jgi:hypothetical protein